MYLLYSEPDNHVNKYFKTFTAFFSSFNFLLDNLDEKASWMTKKPHHMSFVVFMSANKRSECTIQHLNRDRKKGKYEQNKDFEVCKARSDPARYIIGPQWASDLTYMLRDFTISCSSHPMKLGWITKRFAISILLKFSASKGSKKSLMLAGSKPPQFMFTSVMGKLNLCIG